MPRVELKEVVPEDFVNQMLDTAKMIKAVEGMTSEEIEQLMKSRETLIQSAEKLRVAIESGASIPVTDKG